MRPLSLICLLAIVMGSPLSWVSLAEAHHIRGLPHYGYAENYPQNPTYEVQGVVDTFRVHLSAFEIYDTREVDIAVYVFNEEANKAYSEGLTISVSDGSTTTSGPGVPDVSNTYHVRWVYEEGGIYQVEVTFYAGGEPRGLTLPLKVGTAGNWWSAGLTVGGVAAGLVIFLLIVARIKGQRAKENASDQEAAALMPAANRVNTKELDMKPNATLNVQEQ